MVSVDRFEEVEIDGSWVDGFRGSESIAVALGIGLLCEFIEGKSLKKKEYWNLELHTICSKVFTLPKIL